MLGSKILEMRLEHANEQIDIVGRLRNFENALVSLLIRKRDPQGQFFCNQIDRAQAQRELVQKSAQHEKQRLSGFDLMLKLEAFLEGLRRSNEFEHAIES